MAESESTKPPPQSTVEPKANAHVVHISGPPPAQVSVRAGDRDVISSGLVYASPDEKIKLTLNDFVEPLSVEVAFETNSEAKDSSIRFELVSGQALRVVLINAVKPMLSGMLANSVFGSSRGRELNLWLGTHKMGETGVVLYYQISYGKEVPVGKN